MANRVIRTFSMLGADGAGKTALVEALLRAADPKRASPEGSSSRLDAEPEEKKRNFTLSLHPETFEESGRLFNVLDCPGFSAFLAEVEWALQVTDGALLAVSAVDGVHNRAERTFDVLAEAGVPAHRRRHPHRRGGRRLRQGARRRRGVAQGPPGARSTCLSAPGRAARGSWIW